MVDLSTRYLGLELRTPLVAASSPLTGELSSLRELEDHGASAVVLPSLFEEQITHEAMERSEEHTSELRHMSESRMPSSA